MQQLFTLPGCHLILFKAHRGTLPFSQSYSSLYFSGVCVQCSYMLHEQKKIFLYDQRIREVWHSVFTPPALWESCHIFCKRLVAMLSEVTAIQQNYVDTLPLLQTCLEIQFCVSLLISRQKILNTLSVYIYALKVFLRFFFLLYLH